MQGESVRIADYDPTWPQIFAELRERLLHVLGGIAIAIEHVGSTSVPNLPAKPIIDLDVVVRAEDVPAATAILEQHGYRHEGNLGIEDREAYRWIAEGPQHHLYVCPEGSAAFTDHIMVRDYLRNHPQVARDYGELKRRLAERYRHDRAKYQESKTDFILRLLRMATGVALQDAN